MYRNFISIFVTGTGFTSSLNSGNTSNGSTSPNPFMSHTGFETTLMTGVRRLDSCARENLGQHLVQLLATIVLPDPPQSIPEVDARLVDGLPSIPDKLMPSDSDMEHYRVLAEKRSKKMLHLPVDKIYAALKVIILLFTNLTNSLLQSIYLHFYHFYNEHQLCLL